MIFFKFNILKGIKSAQYTKTKYRQPMRRILLCMSDRLLKKINRYSFLKKTSFVLIKLTLICLITLSSLAQAITLDEARQNHWVGETFNGLIAKTDKDIHLKPVGNHLLDAFINDINKKRSEAYSNLASKNHLSTEIIAKIAGQKLIANTPKGLWVKGINGQWVRKE